MRALVARYSCMFGLVCSCLTQLANQSNYQKVFGTQLAVEEGVEKGERNVEREIEGKGYKQQFSSSRIVTTQLSPSVSVCTVQRHVACHNAVIICHFDTMPTRSPPNQVPLCEAPLEAARARLAGSIEIMTFWWFSYWFVILAVIEGSQMLQNQ